MEIRGGQSRYDVINYLKGFYIITIVLMHLIQNYNVIGIIDKVSSLGGTGVHIFFFCSGFGLYLSQRKKELSYFEFLKSKFFKIYIPYIIVVLIIAIVPFTFDGSFNERISALASHLLLYKMFIPEFEGSFSYPLWYMSTLFQFYLVFVVLYKVKKIISVRLFAAICFLISCAWWIITGMTVLGTERIWYSFFLQYLWEFAIGMCLAEKLYNNETIKIKTVYLLPIAIFGLAIGGVLGSMGGVLKSFNDCFLAVGYGGIALVIYRFVKPYRSLCEKICEFSYEWYLTHATCFLIIKKMLAARLPVQGFATVLSMTVSLLLSVVVAVVYHKLIRTLMKRL